MHRTDSINRIACIHQPPFLPWLGVIESMLICDFFVIYDDVQFTYGGYQNRNKILTHHGPLWLTIPIQHRFSQKLNEVTIATEFNPHKIQKSLQFNYAKTKYFANYFSDIKILLENNYQKLIDINMAFLWFIKNALNTKCQFVFSSQLNLEQNHRSQRLANICEQLQANIYYSGSGTKNYIQMECFDTKKIKIVWHDYENRHAIYPQQHQQNKFISSLSFLDMLFNCGATAMRELLLHSGKQKLLENGIDNKIL